MKKSKSVVKKTTKNEVAKVAKINNQDNMVQTLITQAIDKNVPVETLERLLAMRDKLKAESAKEAFDRDMASFQGECPIIKKTKSVPTKKGGIAYRYAPLDHIISEVKEILTKWNFSYSVKTETKSEESNKMVVATCIVRHTMGHIEESSMELPLGTQTQIMSQTQVVASALTFAKRYAFCNVFGIMTSDDDDEIVLKDDEKKDSTNYLDLLKKALYKKGAKNKVEAIEVFNKVTGQNIKSIPDTNNDVALDMYSDFVSCPTIEDENTR